MTDEPTDDPNPTEPLAGVQGEDLLPSMPGGRRAPRRRWTGRGWTRRRWSIVAGLLGALVLVVALLVAVGGSGGEDGAAAERDRAEDATSTSTRHVSKTSSTTEAGPRTTTTTIDLDAIPSEPATVPTLPDPDAAAAKIGLSTVSCDWDKGSALLRSAGTLTNANADSYRVGVAKTWYAREGSELTGAADQWFVDPGESLEWELTNGWDEAPSGLRCEASLEVLL